jgi:hypothetical protein
MVETRKRTHSTPETARARLLAHLEAEKRRDQTAPNLD